MAGNKEFLPPEIDSFLSDAVETILKIVGSDKVELISLAGSAASGEATLFSRDDRIYVLSDFDVYVILTRSEDVPDMLRMRREIGKRCSDRAKDIVLLSGFHVGFYSVDELAKLPRNPAIFHLRNTSRALYGNRDCLKFIPDFSAFDIPVSESCVILENRACNLLSMIVKGEEGKGTIDELIVQYELSRVYTDVAKSLTIAFSNFIPGYRERLQYLSDIRRNGSFAEIVLDEELFDKIKLATEFKLNLPELLENSDFSSFKPFSLKEAAEDLRKSWRRIIKFIDESSEEEKGLPFCSANENISRLENLRSWLGVFKEFGFITALKLSYNFGTGLFRFSPFDFIRSYAMVLLGHYSKYGSEGNVVHAPGGFPYSSGKWNEAVAELVDRWDSFVNGE